MGKLGNQRGETLLESLASILIAALTFAFFATVIVVVGKINAQVRDTDIDFRYAATEGGIVRELHLQGELASGTERVEVYQAGEYYYYIEQTVGEGD